MNNLPIDRPRWIGLALVALFGSASAIDVHPRVAAAIAANGASDALIVFDDQSIPGIDATLDPKSRRRALVAALMQRAESQQREVRTSLDSRGVSHRDFWLVNAIQATLSAADLDMLATRGLVRRVDANPSIASVLPTPALQPQPSYSPQAVDEIQSVGWGVTKIGAPSVWAAGVTGQGVVIGGEDTGIQWDHPILKPQYRGWNGVAANHNFNWHDAIHDAVGANPCGSNSPAPCDDDQHGTHTAGTFAGDDGPTATTRHQYGVAPGAKWIGCRNMDEGAGTPARYIECMQFMLAPSDLNGNNANPDLAADVVSNSWSCPTSEGCSADTLQNAVDTLVAGGIFYAAAAQNSGPSCSSISDPPALYDSAFVVGATNQSDALASFSSIGPVSTTDKIRPDLVAPGVNVCSSIPTDAYSCSFSGTSMATPHVAGAAALLMSAFPELKGRPEKVASILRDNTATAGVTDPNGGCASESSTLWPNYKLGYGRLDVYAAYHDIIAIHGFDG
jgi:serine protease AprX